MKLWLQAFAMCQSMFCALPCPWNVWEEKARDRMLQCLPLVGLEIGAVWFGIGWLCRFLNIPPLLTAAVLAACPWLLTGMMHMDGFMDVTDAVKSWRSLERRREILKDSHVGSFAVIYCALVLLLQAAACASFREGMDLRLLLLIPVVSRCGSAMAVIWLPPMQTSQYVQREKSVRNLLLPLICLAGALGAAFLLGWQLGAVLVIQCVVYAWFLRRAYRSLEGMNGDIAGYCLVLAELGALCAAAVLL